jgi:hypothetical protein
LLDTAQALKIRMFDEFENDPVGHFHKSVYRVVEDFSVHYTYIARAAMLPRISGFTGQYRALSAKKLSGKTKNSSPRIVNIKRAAGMRDGIKNIKWTKSRFSGPMTKSTC